VAWEVPARRSLGEVSDLTDQLIPPAGGSLVDRQVDEAELAAFREQAERLPEVALSDAAAADAWLIGEGAKVFQEAVNFRRPPGRLWNIVRRRFFEVSVRPLASSVSFGSGWYEEEGSGGEIWRWMGARSMTRLSAMPGRAELRLRFHLPTDGKHPFPVVTISLNGQIVDRFRPATAGVEKTYAVAGRGTTPNDLVIETDGVINLGRAGIAPDSRDLGIQLQELSWRPVR